MPLAYGAGVYGGGVYGGTMLVGETVTAVITIRDELGALVEDAVWTVLYSKTSTGATIGLDIMASDSPGTYLVVRDLLSSTAHHIILQAVATGKQYVFYGTTHIVSAASPFAAHTGEAFQEVIFLGDANNDGIGGRTFTTVTSFDPVLDGFTVSVSEISGVSGGYIATFTPDLVGFWSAEIEANTVPPQRFSMEAQVYDRDPGTTGDDLAGGGQVTWTPITTYDGTVQWTVINEE